MYTFVLMLVDFIFNKNLHWFMLFFLFIILRWASVYFNAIRYKPYEYENPDFFASVVIPVVDEPLDLFEDVLGRISKQLPNEIIVVINGPKNPGLEKLCADFNQAHVDLEGEDKWTRIICRYTAIAGKRNAIREGLEMCDPRSEIVVLVDSDTIWTKGTLHELLKPFACDENIGGVTTRQKILKPNRRLVTMFASLLEEIRAEGTMKAMSVYGKVGCLPGRTIAFRTAILKDVIDEFMTETFMGFHKEVSDDRSLTNLTLKKGFKTVMQDTSLVYTDAPVEWKKFCRQQLRWAEGSQYNNLKMTGWMFRHAKLMCFIFWSDMLMPFLLLSVYGNILLTTLLRHFGIFVATINYTGSVWFIAVMIYLGTILFFGARNHRVLSQLPLYYIFLIPVFIVILTVIMVPIRILGLMRCADGMGWGTRKISEEKVS